MPTKSEILAQTIQNSHAVIVEIPRGFGFDFAEKKLELPPQSEVIRLLPTIHEGRKTEQITVADIEELQSKMIVRGGREQFVIFQAAEKMNEQAQNKFLKLLEEPRAGVHFILLTSPAEHFLSTVRSRSQLVQILPISELESIQFLKKFKLTDEKNRQILFLAKGLPAKMEQLASDKKYFASRLEVVEAAKTWLSGSNFDRLIIANSLKNDREKALDLLEQILQLLRVTMKNQTARKNAQEMRKLLKVYRQIAANGNVRLNLVNAILN